MSALTEEQENAMRTLGLSRLAPEAEAYIRQIILARMPAPAPQLVSVPTFREGEIEGLDHAARKLYELGQALTDIARDLLDAVKNAQRLRDWTPPIRPAMPAPRDEEKRPTAIAAGPVKLLKFIRCGGTPKRTDCEIGCSFSPGTVRTYLPILEGAGFIKEHAMGIEITPEGIAFLSLL